MPFTEVAVRQVRTHGLKRRLFDPIRTIASVEAMPGRLYAITLADESCPVAMIEIVVELIEPPSASDAGQCHDPGRAVPSVRRCAWLRSGPPQGS